MAKSLVKNKLGSKTYGFIIPSDATSAVDFLNLLDGEYEVYEKQSESGNETVNEAFKVRVQIRNTETDQRDYITMYIDTTKNEEDVKNALIGQVVNGINVDEVVIIEFKRETFSTGSTGSTGSGSSGG